MFLQKQTKKSTADYLTQIDCLQWALEAADAVVIGAGAGLSASAGFTYCGERFEAQCADFEAKYGFHDMYAGAFYPFETEEEHWAYWSRFIACNRYDAPVSRVYLDLLALVQSKNYFVLTTNVDHQFQLAGFAKDRLFYTQGDYGLFQCSTPCCQETFENIDAVHKMLAQQKAMKIPTELIPRCPHCGKPMTMNLRSDHRFVEDAGWHAAAERYENFIVHHQNKQILFLELGVGFNTPGIIKYPFWQMTQANPNAIYACLNLENAACPSEISEQAVCISADVGKVLAQICGKREMGLDKAML